MFQLKESYHAGTYALLKHQGKFNHFGIGSHTEITDVVAAGTNLHLYELLGPERKPYGDLEWCRMINDPVSFEAECRDMLPAQLERFRQALIVAGHHCGAIPGEDDALMTSFGPDEKHPGHWKYSVHLIVNQGVKLRLGGSLDAFAEALVGSDWDLSVYRGANQAYKMVHQGKPGADPSRFHKLPSVRLSQTFVVVVPVPKDLL